MDAAANQFQPGDRAVFVYPAGYVFGTVLPPKTKSGTRMRLAVVDGGAIYPKTEDWRTTRVEYHPDWGNVVATYGITEKTKKLVRWINPNGNYRELWSGGIPYFRELYDCSKEPYTRDFSHDW